MAVARNLLISLGLDASMVASFAAVCVVAALIWARRSAVQISHALAAAGVGCVVGFGWLLIYLISQSSCDVVAISSVTFTGPSADTLMALINAPDVPLGFGIGLVPGVFVGAGIMALVSQEAK